MLLEAISGIIAISVVFCCCTFCCYLFFQFMFTEGKDDVQPEAEVWEAKHYYDPLPLSTPSPPDAICKPTPYTFKLQNGNGVYAAPLSMSLPHAVINPAVLQYPPGHVLDQQRVPPKNQPPAQTRKENETKRSKRHTRSRSPSPSPRGTKNVWSTNTEFKQTHPYYQQQHRPPQYYEPHHQQQQFTRQYVQLTQEHYPVHKRQPKNIRFPSEEFPRESSPPRQQHHRGQQPQQQQQQTQYEPFMASSHATNIYNSFVQYDHDEGRHPEHTKHKHRSHRSRHKEAVT